MTPDTERDRGVLSPADRAYLRNPDDYSRQASHEREKAIKQRIADSVLDLAFLYDHLPADIHAGVFGRGGVWGELSTEFDEPLAAGVAFLHSVVRERYQDTRKEVLEDGVRRAEERATPTDSIAVVDVSIKPQQQSALATKGAKKIDAGERLTDAELRATLQEKTADPEDVAAHLQGEDVDLPHWGALE